MLVRHAIIIFIRCTPWAIGIGIWAKLSGVADWFADSSGHASEASWWNGSIEVRIVKDVCLILHWSSKIDYVDSDARSQVNVSSIVFALLYQDQQIPCRGSRLDKDDGGSKSSQLAFALQVFSRVHSRADTEEHQSIGHQR